MTHASADSIESLGSFGNRTSLAQLPAAELFAWIASALLHLGLFAMLYWVWTQEAPFQKPDIIPEARLAGPQTTEALPQFENTLELARTDAPIAEPLEIAMPEDIPIAALLDQPTPSIELPTIAPVAAEHSATNATAGSLIAGPLANFYGETGNAYKIVYIVDLSYSVAQYRESFLAELRRSIQSLVPSQRFNIVMAEQEGRVSTLAKDRLVPANAKYKTEASAFLKRFETHAKPGPADPIKAFKSAFAAKPELIYVLTDGDYADVSDALRDELRRLNADKATKITALTFVQPTRTLPLFKEMTEPYGGNIRVVEP